MFALSSLEGALDNPALLRIDQPPDGCQVEVDEDGFSLRCNLRRRDLWIICLAAVVLNGMAAAVFISLILDPPELDQLIMATVFATGWALFGIFVVRSAVLCLWGRLELEVRNGQGHLFVGLGRRGRRRSFDFSAVTSIQDWKERGAMGIKLKMGRQETVPLFRRVLTEPKRTFAKALLVRQLLLRTRPNDPPASGWCGHCGRPIDERRINPDKAIAYCRSCKELLWLDQSETTVSRVATPGPADRSRSSQEAMTPSVRAQLKNARLWLIYAISLAPLLISCMLLARREGTFTGVAMGLLGAAFGWVSVYSLLTGQTLPSMKDGTIYIRKDQPVRYWYCVLIPSLFYILLCSIGWIETIGYNKR